MSLRSVARSVKVLPLRRSQEEALIEAVLGTIVNQNLPILEENIKLLQPETAVSWREKEIIPRIDALEARIMKLRRDVLVINRSYSVKQLAGLQLKIKLLTTFKKHVIKDSDLGMWPREPNNRKAYCQAIIDGWIDEVEKIRASLQATLRELAA